MRAVPTDGKLWPMTIAVTRYARGIAHAVLGDVQAAEEEYKAFVAATAAVPSHYMRHNNYDAAILSVGDSMLRGEIEYRKGQYDAAFESLRTAVSLSDNLAYDEPWGWMQPPRHALGALLLEQGHVEEAEAQFRRDMDPQFYGRCHPDNVWALRGLAGCLSAKLSAGGYAAAGGGGATSAVKPSCSKCPSSSTTASDSDVDAVLEELNAVQRKLATLFPNCDLPGNVACMCAK